MSKIPLVKAIKVTEDINIGILNFLISDKLTLDKYYSATILMLSNKKKIIIVKKIPKNNLFCSKKTKYNL